MMDEMTALYSLTTLTLCVLVIGVRREPSSPRIDPYGNIRNALARQQGNPPVVY